MDLPAFPCAPGCPDAAKGEGHDMTRETALRLVLARLAVEIKGMDHRRRAGKSLRSDGAPGEAADWRANREKFKVKQ